MTGREFRKVRLGLGLTQKALARMMGVQENTIWRYENRGVPRFAELALKGVLHERGLRRGA